MYVQQANLSEFNLKDNTLNFYSTITPIFDPCQSHLYYFVGLPLIYILPNGCTNTIIIYIYNTKIGIIIILKIETPSLRKKNIITSTDISKNLPCN